MNRRPLTAEERMRRLRRDQEAYRRRSLWRRSHPRFRRDLAIVPFVFLLPRRASMATLRRPADEVLLALRGRAVWTLDTAARLATGQGFLTSRDLTGYLDAATLHWLVRERGLADEPVDAGLSVDPLYERPPVLIAHIPEEPPPFLELPGGDRVVPWKRLAEDLLGTLGWRPDLLTRLEASYPGAGHAG